MNPKNEIVRFLRENDGYFIATHINPDGDALGSALALSMALKSMGKTTRVFNRDPVPDFYYFIPGWEDFTSEIGDVSGLTLVLLDCNSPSRANLDNVTFVSSAVIDHHDTESDFGDVRWVDPGSAATGLMVFELIRDLGVELNADMATNLYTAIALDTGTFRYGNTDSRVFRAAAELSDAGAVPQYVAEGLYQNWSVERLRLLSLAMRTLEIIDDIAIMSVTKEMFEATGAKPADTENFSNIPRMAGSILVSALFRETEDGAFKVSLRSKGDYNVAEIAEGFGGGGHRNAAGYRYRGSLDSVKEAFLAALKAAK